MRTVLRRLVVGALAVLLVLLPYGFLDPEPVEAQVGPAGPGGGITIGGATLPQGAATDWWTGVQQQVRQLEYEVTWQPKTLLPDLPEAYHAPNRAQNLRAYFAPEGIRLLPRTGDGSAWEIRLALAGVGTESRLAPVSGVGERVARGNRMEYRRPGLVEWWVNEERGLEQGFTVEQAPAGGGPLVVALQASGTAPPRLSADGSAVEFVTASGARVLRYGDSGDVTGDKSSVVGYASAAVFGKE